MGCRFVTGTPTATVPRISEPVISMFSGISSGACATWGIASPARAASVPKVVSNDVVHKTAAIFDILDWFTAPTPPVPELALSSCGWNAGPAESADFVSFPLQKYTHVRLHQADTQRRTV